MRRIISAMPRLLVRLSRVAGVAVALVVIGTGVVLMWDWLKVIAPPRLYPRYLAIGLQEAFLASYFVILVMTALGMLLSTVVVCRSRSKSIPGRWLLLFGSIILGLILTELASAVLVSHRRQLPRFPFILTNKPVRLMSS